jgi:4-hydroxybenzoate polyprenyltransferase
MLPTWWTLILASKGHPSFELMVVFAAGSFLMRSAGVAMNDWADRSIDREVARTRTRPLASGVLSTRDAACVIAVLLAFAAALLLMLSPLVTALSPVAVLLAAAYPFSKRVIPLPQVILGAAFGWGVIMAWAAARNTVEGPAWLIYVATVCWVVGYDTIYALQDCEDDRRIGVHSSAVWLGTNAWLAIAGAFGLMLGCLALSGWLSGLGLVFYGTLAAVGGFLSQQVVATRRQMNAERAFALFRQHVWVGWAILGGIWAGYL